MADGVTLTETSEATTETTANDAVTALGGAGIEATTETSTDEAPPVLTAEEQVAADAQAAEDAAAAKAAEVPENYELTVSDGLTIDPVSLEAATPVFKELGLSNEQANKLMPVAEQFAKNIGDNLNRQILESVAAERKAWLDTAKSDPEIGGQHWDSSLVTAAKALDGLGFEKGSPFRNLLDESGLGNHPDMIRAFVKVGKAISEDSDFPRTGAATSGQRTLADTLYPPKS